MKKAVATFAAAGLAGLGLTVMLATPAYALPPSCDWYNETTNTHVIASLGDAPTDVMQAAVGDQISVTCTDLLAGGLAIVYSSPLAAVAVPTPAQVTAGVTPAGAMAKILSLDLGFGGGSASVPAVPLPSGSLGAGTDPQATCPPSQAQVDAGLTNCALAVANLGLTQQSVVMVHYTSGATNPTPAAPTVQVTNGSGGFVGGNSVNLGDGATGHFWNYLTQGAPAPLAGIPNPTVLIDGTTPATSALTVTPPSYVNASCGGAPVPTCGAGGVLTPPDLGGSFTWPSGLSAGSHSVTVVGPVLAPPGTTAGGQGTACSGTFPTNCVSASTLASQQGASVASLFSPASGVGSAGNTLTFDVSNVDTQGSMICQPQFTNGGAIPASPPLTSGACPVFTGSTGTVTGQSTGTLHVTIPITAAVDPGPNNIYLAWDPPGSSQQLVIPYTVSSLATTCGPIASGDCDVSQIINQNVIGTAAGLSQTEVATGGNTPPNVQMSNITLNGFQQTSNGVLNTDVVQDIRGTLVGWTVTAVFQDDLLNGTPVGNHNTIPVSGFNWAPSVSLNVASPPSGYIADVLAGATTTAGFDAITHTGLSRTLCSAAPGGGGGTFNCAAALTLAVPAGVAAGAYSAVLQITIT